MKSWTYRGSTGAPPVRRHQVHVDHRLPDGEHRRLLPRHIWVGYFSEAKHMPYPRAERATVVIRLRTWRETLGRKPAWQKMWSAIWVVRCSRIIEDEGLVPAEADIQHGYLQPCRGRARRMRGILIVGAEDDLLLADDLVLHAFVVPQGGLKKARSTSPERTSSSSREHPPRKGPAPPGGKAAGKQEGSPAGGRSPGGMGKPSRSFPRSPWRCPGAPPGAFPGGGAAPGPPRSSAGRPRWG